jgi:hypothetical protein
MGDLALDDFGECEPKRGVREKDLCLENVRPEAEATREVCQWSEATAGTFQAAGATQKVLESGAYRFSWWNGRVAFVRVPIETDVLIDFEDSVFSKVVKEIEDFWKLEEIYNKHGFLHKRGYLLYGPAGTGKSCLVQRIIKDILDKGGIAFLCCSASIPDTVLEGLRVFRMVEKNRPVICVYEDLDSILA